MQTLKIIESNDTKCNCDWKITVYEEDIKEARSNINKLKEIEHSYKLIIRCNAMLFNRNEKVPVMSFINIYRDGALQVVCKNDELYYTSEWIQSKD